MKRIVIAILLLIALPLCGQSIFGEQILAPLQKDQLPFEKVYIHTNKSSYLPEDTIWFQAFVGNHKNGPSRITTRLHVNLLNAEGTVMLSKNIFIENGTGAGQLELIDLSSGIYFIQAYTQNLRNFGAHTFYLQEFQVLATGQELSTKTSNNYDIDIIPEGGYFVENTTTNMTIKASKNGLKLDFSAEIVNGNDLILQGFDSEYKGIAKFSLSHEADKIYTAVLKFNDTIISQQLPDPKKEGIVLNLDNSNEESLKIILKTNKKTLKSDYNSNFSLVSHQRNQVGAHVPFTKMDSLMAVITLNKTKLSTGVNTITLFKNDQPIAQRDFFVDKKDLNVNIDVQEISPSIDSLRYKIRLSNNDKPLNAILSVSVISDNKEKFRLQQSIKSAFHLTPYTKEYLENPAYYLDENNEDRLAHLDLILLAQKNPITSKEEFLERNNPSKIFEPEYGYSISGTIKRPFLSNRFALISKYGELVDDVVLSGNDRFKFDNLLLFKGDTLKFTFIDDFKFLEPNGVDIDSVETNFPKQLLPIKNTVFDQKSDLNNTRSNTLVEGGNILDEVLVTAKKRSDAFLRRQEYLNRYKLIIPKIGEYAEVPIPENLKSFSNDLMSFLEFYEGIKIIHTDAGENYLITRNGKEILLYIDGSRIYSEEIPGLDITMTDVENILRVNRPVNILEPPKYQVFTKPNYKNGIKEQFITHESLTGYDRQKKYRSPISNVQFRNEKRPKEINWKPNLKTNANGEIIFSIAKKDSTNGLNLNLEGFSNDGFLISKQVNLN